MRDLFVAAVVFGSLPFILKRPWLGILMWSWLGYMNPHRLAWGFVTTMPVALMVALATFAGMLASREKKEIPWTRETVLLLIFTGWMFVSTLLAQYPGMAWPQWDKVWRIILMTYVTMMLITNRERVHWLVVVIALSIGFYGFKGGTFILMGGAGNNVMGPSGSFIADRNSVGLALIMIIPLLWYVRLQTDIKLVRTALLVGGALTLIGIIGTNSRGALLGLAAMGLFFIMKARNRFGIILALIPVVLVVLYVMPQEWFDRMHTIETYEEDASAMGRIYAWKNAIELANMHFIGGGFRAVTGYGGTDSHSNWFGVLGEQGWIGLGMFVLLHVFTWLSAKQIIQWSKPHPSLDWARDLAAMVQVSLIGYMSAGSFLGLQYFDLFYHLIAIIVITKMLVQKELDAMRGRGMVMPAAIPNEAVARRPLGAREEFSPR
jgi:probable O-glycosylation ligase (exosortase A-associated)